MKYPYNQHFVRDPSAVDSSGLTIKGEYRLHMFEQATALLIRPGVQSYFVAAATLADLDGGVPERAPAEVAEMAEGLQAAHNYIEDNPSTPVAILDRRGVSAAVTTADSELGVFSISTDRAPVLALGYVHCYASTGRLDLSQTGVDLLPHRSSYGFNQGHAWGDDLRFISRHLPTHFLVDAQNLDRVRAFSRRFGAGGVMAVGEQAISSLLEEGSKRGLDPRKEASQRRKIARATAEWLEELQLLRVAQPSETEKTTAD